MLDHSYRTRVKVSDCHESNLYTRRRESLHHWFDPFSPDDSNEARSTRDVSVTRSPWPLNGYELDIRAAPQRRMTRYA